MQSAAAAYDKGTSSYLSKNYAAAARWFETADRLAPSETALRQAIRSHQKAGNVERAGSLALKSQATYDEASKDVTQAIQLAEKTYLRVNVECSQCALAIDGSAVDFPEFFVSANEAHEVTATFETGSITNSVEGDAGDAKTIRFEAPDPPPIEETAPPVRSRDGLFENTNDVDAETKSNGLPKGIFFVAAGLTVVAGGVVIASGLNAKSDVPAYEQAAADARQSPTSQNISRAQELLEAGQKKERRTNILIGVTAGLAVTTVVLGVLTNWKSSKDSKEVAVSAGPTRDGFGLSVDGRF